MGIGGGGYASPPCAGAETLGGRAKGAFSEDGGGAVGVGDRKGDGVGLALGGRTCGAAMPTRVCLTADTWGGETAGGRARLGGDGVEVSLDVASARVGSWSLSKMWVFSSSSSHSISILPAAASASDFVVETGAANMAAGDCLEGGKPGDWSLGDFAGFRATAGRAPRRGAATGAGPPVSVLRRPLSLPRRLGGGGGPFVARELGIPPL